MKITIYKLVNKRIHKSIILTLANLLIITSIFAQTPQKMSYQAVIRNSSDALIANTQVGMKISILQGSATGTAVYTETQTPTTNANGLVSIEIGGGTGFSSINWSTGNYYIKTETDPSGGTSYSISGTSQLLSVPYALYAGNSSNLPIGTSGQTLRHNGSQWVSSSLIENNGTNVGIGSSPVDGAKLYINRTADDFGPNLSGIYSYRYGAAGATSGGTSWASSGVDAAIKGYSYYGNNYTSGVAGYSYLDYDKSAGVIGSKSDGTIFGALAYKESSSLTWAGYFTGNAKIIGTLSITGGSPGSGKVLTSDASGNATWTAPSTTPTHYIGESYGGGKVFWVDATGQHGLIAATSDQSAAAEWYNGTSKLTGTTGDGLYAGEMNTTLIIALQIADNPNNNFAAKICADYSVTVNGVTYGDWYLPSMYELNLLYLQKTTIGGFTAADYWSSTEYISMHGWAQNFSYGAQDHIHKSNTFMVRAIRAF